MTGAQDEGNDLQPTRRFGSVSAVQGTGSGHLEAAVVEYPLLAGTGVPQRPLAGSLT